MSTMPETRSLRDWLLSLNDEQRTAAIASLDPKQAEALLYDWQLWARPEQLEPAGEWLTWLIQAGRGFGKTRVGAEWVREQVEKNGCRRIALVGRTASDTRDVMVEGESGILSVSPPWFRPRYEPSKRRLTWPNGAIATTYSADEPDLLRGPQHDAAWCDELAAWRFADTWDMLQFGLRLGPRPRCVVTTTPRPRKVIRDLVADPACHVTRGSTFDNIDNLAPSFIRAVVRRYEGTTLGRQELKGELLEDIPGAHWTRSTIENGRVKTAPESLSRLVVAIDPAATSNEGADETGIIVAGVADVGAEEHGYVLEDLSGRYTPSEWARVAIEAYTRWKAGRIVAEVNNGGEMVENTLRVIDPNVSYRAVHASRGKAIRAEPVAALYEQGRVHHVGGYPELEDQMVGWTPDADFSPDRMDALVWALTDLIVESGNAVFDWMRKDLERLKGKQG